MLQLNRAQMTVLLDPGSFITLAHPLALTKIIELCRTLMVTCVNRDVRDIPAAEVQVGC